MQGLIRYKRLPLRFTQSFASIFSLIIDGIIQKYREKNLSVVYAFFNDFEWPYLKRGYRSLRSSTTAALLNNSLPANLKMNDKIHR